MNVFNFLLLVVVLSLFVAFFLYYSKRNNALKKKQPNQQSLDKYFVTNNNTAKNTNSRYMPEDSLYNIAKTDLQYLKHLSNDQMNKIISEEIYSIQDLREKIKSKKDIEDFSERIGVYKRIVNGWIKLGEFSILTGINQEYIDLFSTVNINSLEDLSKYDPEKLYELLKKENQNDPNRIPTIGMLSHWIRIAKKTDFERIKLNYGI